MTSPPQQQLRRLVSLSAQGPVAASQAAATFVYAVTQGRHAARPHTVRIDPSRSWRNGIALPFVHLRREKDIKILVNIIKGF